MIILASIFAVGVALRNAMYDRGIFKARKLQGPVVSIGNISVGGSGKTPFVIMLGRLLVARGINFDVLSRGYGRRKRGIALVDPEGTPEDFGDEPLLISQQLNMPVIVGANRHHAGIYAERKFGPQLHLLDDGFQHRSLARDFDIVLVNSEDCRDRLLPAGRLRELPTTLQRAHAIVVTNARPPGVTPFPGKLIWQIHRGIAPQDLPTRPVVFCGIARPKNFVSELRDAGVAPAAESFYRDHQAYSGHEVEHLLKLREQNNANGFVTTEKDAINLGPLRAALDPLAIVPVTMELLDADNAVDTMLRTIGAPTAGVRKSVDHLA